MNGTPGHGGIQQSFLTTKGQRYRVTPAITGIPKNYGGGWGVKKLGVSAAGVNQEFLSDTPGDTPDKPGWTTKTWEFVAVSGETTLEFYSLDWKNPFAGPGLDEVRVVAVPASGPG